MKLRRSYTRELPKLLQGLKLKNHPKNKKKAKKIINKTITGRPIREIERKLPEDVYSKYQEEISLFKKVHSQKREDKDKIYSLHEPGVYCISKSKGKDHKKYEFGTKVAIARTKDTGIIVVAVNFEKNVYDGHTLPDVLKQVEEIVGKSPEVAICDRGFRGKIKIGETKIVIPKKSKNSLTAYKKNKIRKRFRRGAAIEPVIGHLKSDFRMARNFLKGTIGDTINLLMAAAYNFKKLMDQLVLFFSLYYFCPIFRQKIQGRDLLEEL